MTTQTFDKEGFLKDIHQWNPELANVIAENEGIELSEEHFEVIQVARQFYEEFGLSPVNRVLVKAVKQQLGDEKGSSMYLLKLFREGPAKMVCKIAGLPKPNNCL
ncbi:sulfurtransferase TusE [Hahella sp. CCB-MM4]|uniref:TusE/DsrC/DsvC family sulfur relay protein n=1 Tax=Hahella sp. (strain CCB-MM4) TaxID=1926491 RepID=UPI000B9BDE65|nr:TusE/DsrC/DsvC family sulfur relay protein [Hahella sp. CCB-MM4]OZG73623.1 sulfurtransferase TusE [Hahella sp. CCB-MM4]